MNGCIRADLSASRSLPSTISSWWTDVTGNIFAISRKYPKNCYASIQRFVTQYAELMVISHRRCGRGQQTVTPDRAAVGLDVAVEKRNADIEAGNVGASPSADEAVWSDSASKRQSGGPLVRVQRSQVSWVAAAAFRQLVE